MKVYQYEPSTGLFRGTAESAEGTVPPNSTDVPLPAGAVPGDVYIWTYGAWVKKLDGIAPVAEVVYVPMLPFDFLNRLLQTERTAILTLAQTDMNAADFNNLLNHAPTVTLNDPRLVAGVNYCASQIPAITAARVAAILDPSK